MPSLPAAPWGAIFDWDGVIIDSSRHHAESWLRLANEEQRTLPEHHFEQGFGRKNEFIIPHILGWTQDPVEIHRLSLRKESLYRDVVAEWGIEPLPGVRPWLTELAQARVPCAIGSSTHRANIDLSLSLLGLAPFFAQIVSAEDVTRGKPDPQVFLIAAERIARAPAACVVFEDAFAGFDAARAAGMRLIGVATTHPLEALTQVDRAVLRLDELNVESLASWFS
jgi:HAD superfamily hydrolase (TIGR01509 family)